MKAVIAAPSVSDFYFTPSRASALGAVNLQKILLKFGIEAEIFNFPVRGGKPAKLRLPIELEHLEPLLIPGETGPVSFFTAYRRFGPQPKECAAELLQSGADTVFISCFAWPYTDDCIELAAAIKRLNPNTITVIGGPGVTVNPGYFIAEPSIDYTLPGPAENIIPSFIKKMIPEQSEQHILSSGNPEPDFIWSETGVSKIKKTRFISAMLTRGCPKQCRFCANHLVHGREFRKAALKDIRTGINSIPNGLTPHINLEDDNLLIDKDFLFITIDIIKSRFPEATFSAENGLDYTYMSRDTVRRLIDSGFQSFNLSMASSRRKMLESEKRKLNISRLRSVIESAAGEGIPSTTYFICGLENDTAESVLDNLLTLHKLPTLTGISMFYPVPGLPGFPPERMSSFPPRLCAGSSAYPWNKSLTTAQLVTAFRLSRLSNLIKTRQNRIPSPPENRSPDNSVTDLLLKTIMHTEKFHTISHGRVIPVPELDEKMVSAFLASVTID